MARMPFGRVLLSLGTLGHLSMVTQASSYHYTKNKGDPLSRLATIHQRRIQIPRYADRHTYLEWLRPALDGGPKRGIILAQTLDLTDYQSSARQIPGEASQSFALLLAVAA
jgi:hypothetical protein